MKFKLLRNGCVFEYHESFFVKIPPIAIVTADENRLINAIKLSDGVYWKFKEEENVKKITTMDQLLDETYGTLGS